MLPADRDGDKVEVDTGAYVIQSARRDAFEARRFGHYRLKNKLGSGAMGVVCEAEHLLLKRPSAVKLIRLEYIAGLFAASLQRLARGATNPRVGSGSRSHTMELL
jgi:serine/threonine protein kinase